MKRKYCCYDSEGNWLGNVYARVEWSAWNEAKMTWKNFSKLEIAI